MIVTKTLPTLCLASLLICSSSRVSQSHTEASESQAEAEDWSLTSEFCELVKHGRLDLDNTSRTIINYEGAVQAGLTYRARVRGDKLFGLSLVPAVHLPVHQALRIEWTNLKEFPALKRLRHSGGRQIVFNVVSDETRRMSEWRWNRTVSCKILIVE